MTDPALLAEARVIARRQVRAMSARLGVPYRQVWTVEEHGIDLRMSMEEAQRQITVTLRPSLERFAATLAQAARDLQAARAAYWPPPQPDTSLIHKGSTA